MGKLATLGICQIDKSRCGPRLRQRQDDLGRDSPGSWLANQPDPEDLVIETESLTAEHHDHAETIGCRIGRAREAAGLTAAQAARRLAVKTATWQAWESDRSEPRSNKLIMIAGTLGISPAWLLTGRGEGPTEVAADDVQLLFRELRQISQEVDTAKARLDTVLRRLETFHSYNHVESV